MEYNLLRFASKHHAVSRLQWNTMDQLYQISEARISKTKHSFVRWLDDDIEWHLPLIILKGPRGGGKTTLLLQHLHTMQAKGKSKVLYCTLDHPYFESSTLYDLALGLDKRFKYVYLDEIHKYDRWSQDLKLIHDTLPHLRIAASGSSILDILKGEADLSRRVASYHLPGLSFREYLILKGKFEMKAISLSDILQNHVTLASDISDQISVLTLFKDYLKQGYYPFFKESLKQYPERLLRIINTTIENDIPAFENVDYQTVRNLKKLLYFLAQSAPVSPNVNTLSGFIGVSRTHLLKMFDLMQRANLINLLRSPTSTPSRIAKPDKIYLHNSNLMMALAPTHVESGQIRETFFINQLQVKHDVHTPRYGDFLVDKTYVFEVGGPNKPASQVDGVPDSYLALDGIKIGRDRRIPLWLFGFTY